MCFIILLFYFFTWLSCIVILKKNCWAPSLSQVEILQVSMNQTFWKVNRMFDCVHKYLLCTLSWYAIGIPLASNFVCKSLFWPEDEYIFSGMYFLCAKFFFPLLSYLFDLPNSSYYISFGLRVHLSKSLATISCLLFVLFTN